MNHITLAKELSKRFNTPMYGFGRARAEMLKMGLSKEDIIKVSHILKYIK